MTRQRDHRAAEALFDLPEPGFKVFTVKHSGERALFQRFAQRSEAERVVTTLRSYGLDATIEDPRS